MDLSDSNLCTIFAITKICKDLTDKQCKLFWGVQSTIEINFGNCWMVTKSTLNFFVTKSIMVALWSNSQNHVKPENFCECLLCYKQNHKKDQDWMKESHKTHIIYHFCGGIVFSCLD